MWNIKTITHGCVTVSDEQSILKVMHLKLKLLIGHRIQDKSNYGAETKEEGKKEWEGIKEGRGNTVW